MKGLLYLDINLFIMLEIWLLYKNLRLLKQIIKLKVCLMINNLKH